MSVPLWLAPETGQVQWRAAAMVAGAGVELGVPLPSAGAELVIRPQQAVGGLSSAAVSTR